MSVKNASVSSQSHSKKEQSTPLNQKPEWLKLQNHYNSISAKKLSEIYKSDTDRFKKMSIALGGFMLDYSKHHATEETLELLFDLAKTQQLEEKRKAMFTGVNINASQDRPALHTALRNPKYAPENIQDDVEKIQNDIQTISDAIRADPTITDVVNIGIGGSDIGPRLVVNALRGYSAQTPEGLAHPAWSDDAHKHKTRVHFVSNVDGAHIERLLLPLAPERTAFIICSKSFTTPETLLNAQVAKKWAGRTNMFYAITDDPERAEDFGVPTDKILPLHAWVGGRFSVWSRVGLSVAIAVGFKNFRKFLDGAADMDAHFKSEPFRKNIPILMGLLGVWYRNFWNYGAHAVLPYAHNLEQIPRYVQQIEMESNGKSVDHTGQFINYATAPLVFGDTGTDGQHAFYQCLHQGSDIIPADFIGVLTPYHPHTDMHIALMSNMLAQTEALMNGKSDTEKPHKHFSGGRPSSTILLDTLDPYHLGMLLAAYEHKVFVEGVIWNINSFDQFGVELGKTIARDIDRKMHGYDRTATEQNTDDTLLAYVNKRLQH